MDVSKTVVILFMLPHQYDGSRAPYSQFLLLFIPYGINNFQFIRVAPSPIAKVEPDFLAPNFWILAPIRSLERLGLLFFDRLALSDAKGFRRKGYAIKLYRISDKKDNGLVAQCRNGRSIYGRFGGIGTAVFALGEFPKPKTRKNRIAGSFAIIITCQWLLIIFGEATNIEMENYRAPWIEK